MNRLSMQFDENLECWEIWLDNTYFVSAYNSRIKCEERLSYLADKTPMLERRFGLGVFA